MNEYMQEFMLCHDVQVMNMSEEPNPDNMSYEVNLNLVSAITSSRWIDGEGIKGSSKIGTREIAKEKKY